MANEKTSPNYLMHYRTKGSRNGISTTKGYTAVGQRAKGRFVNGRYVYDREGTQNNWQQRANKAAGKGLTYDKVTKESGINFKYIPTNNPKDKYDYSGKNDDRAPVFKEAVFIDLYGNKTGGKVTKMDRTPYWDHMVNAKTNKEFDKYAKKSKEFLDDFRASKIRNSRSDIGNAFADAKEDAKNAFKALKSKFKKKKKWW